MAYIKIAKPTNKGYLQTEEEGYLLLETGGKIIINSGFSLTAKPLASYTKIAKPAIP